MNRVFTVNFGSAKTGLATVGYMLRDISGAQYQARTIVGVAEFPSTGIYGCNVTLPDTFNGTIEWDTGEATPIYAAEDIALDQYSKPIAAAVSSGIIGDSIDGVRTLLRAHLNQTVDFINAKFDMLKSSQTDELVRMKQEIADNIKGAEEPEVEEEDEIAPVLEAIDKSNKEIQSRHELLLKMLSDIKIPDHERKLNVMAKQVADIRRDIAGAKEETGNLHKQLKQDIYPFVAEMRKEINGIPSKVQIPRYDEHFKELHKRIDNGVSMNLEFGGKSSGVLGGIMNALKEMGPENAEKVRVQRESGAKINNFLTGVRHG